MDTGSTPWGGIIIALLVAIIVSGIAKKRGYYTLPLQKKDPAPSVWSTSFIVITYFLLIFVLSPVFALYAAYFFIGWNKGETPVFTPSQAGWIQTGSIIFTTAVMVCALFLVNRESLKRVVFGGSTKKWRKRALKDFSLGMLSWVIAYPVLLVVNQLTVWVVQTFWGKSGVEQSGVTLLKKTANHSLMSSVLMLFFVILVPFWEELVFRGYLQSWLKKHLGRWAAICITAPLFAFVHFTPSQGMGNIELLSSLLVVAFYLGFLYERQQTLFAPLGLHITFNGISAFGILLTQAG